MDKNVKTVRKFLKSAGNKLLDKIWLIGEQLTNAQPLEQQSIIEYELRLNAYLQESVVQASSVNFADVVGLEDAKRALEDSVILPFDHPQFANPSAARYKSILFWGFRGSGKTHLAKALASETKNAKVILLSLSNAEVELLYRPARFFEGTFEFAEQNQPSVLFVDDLESLVKGKSELSKKLKIAFFDQLKRFLSRTKRESIVVVATYSSGKLQEDDLEFLEYFRLKIELPIQKDAAVKCEILKICMKEIANELSEEDFRQLANKLQQSTPGFISKVAKDSVRYPLRAVRDATHFKRVRGPLPGKPEIIVDDLHTPCSPDDPDAIRMNWTEIKEEKLLVPKVTMELMNRFWKNIIDGCCIRIELTVRK